MFENLEVQNILNKSYSCWWLIPIVVCIFNIRSSTCRTPIQQRENRPPRPFTAASRRRSRKLIIAYVLIMMLPGFFGLALCKETFLILEEETSMYIVFLSITYYSPKQTYVLLRLYMFHEKILIVGRNNKHIGKILNKS